MGLILTYGDGQTPLDPDETEDLLPKTISTQSQLNEVEQLNIEEAIQWTLRRKFTADTILTEAFIKELHKRMYGGVWRWAGEFRKTNKNIGLDKMQIQVGLRTLIDDCKYWISRKTFTEDEIAIRFKHRIVSIHCFANGNGRHSRLFADIIISHIFGQPVFTWGSKTIHDQAESRKAYINALRLADKGDFSQLISFARS